ncbi:Carbohydrate-binding module family 1 protein [Lasiodiplodia theobromae]|uniref:Carbohydrate-binding module family 1 protein n=1 Tax=Lasiodiplodia theobromae TaxID=45133 RepID=UPI0015C3666C|nr:Carbohydrate-binding module family 1 protein [Lasiodiplodia theobromae]KAF4543863.1 Carbohydrate-binding module family 1 protein [Lasiodiplodia theobromae]
MHRIRLREIKCQPGTASTILTTATSGATPSATTAPTNGSTAAGPGTTLQDGYLWIRAVEEPNFHKYLQSAPLYSTGTATIDLYTQAGQFTIDADGQLAQLVSAPGEAEKLLYAHVAGAATRDGRTLAVTFAETKGTYGTFAWQGDALTWSAANVTRPNLSAWYVCEDQALFVNLGNYLYQTPDGCADETIHYYNDKTAND